MIPWRLTVLVATVSFLVACNFPLRPKTVVPVATPLPPPPPTEAEINEAWEKASNPGPEHELLRRFVGRWKVESKWWADPLQPPDVFKGIVDYTDLFGGRFLREDFYGRTARGPFQGLAIWGHDNAKKLYTSVWIDSLGTATMVSYGTFDPIDQKLEFKGDMTDPVTGQQSQIRSVYRIISESEHLFEMYETRGPSQVKTLEVNYKRG